MRTLGVVAVLVLAAPAFGQSITVTYDDCVELTRHIPADDVKYRPDADPDVAPADLPGRRRIQVPREFEIPISVELQKRFNLPPAPHTDLYKSEAMIGVVTYKDGRAWFNGLPIGADDEKEIGYLCRDRLNARR